MPKLNISKRAYRRFQFFGRYGDVCSKRYLDKVILWTVDDEDEVITTSDKITVYGGEMGFFTESGFDLVLQGKEQVLSLPKKESLAFLIGIKWAKP